MHQVSEVRTYKEGFVKKIGSLIAPLVREIGIEEAVRFGEIKKKWKELFKEPLSLHMYPSRLSNGELLINVDSPLWLQQLTFLKTQIIKNLTSFQVKDIRFRIGKVTGPQTRETGNLPPERTALKSDALRQIEDTVEGMEDGVIKESIRRAMEKSLTTKRTK